MQDKNSIDADGACPTESRKCFPMGPKNSLENNFKSVLIFTFPSEGL